MSYYFLDVETTGLDPIFDRLLEVGFVVLRDDLKELGRKSWVMSVPQNEMDVVLENTDPFVIDMHTRNGLLAECMSAPLKSNDAIEDEMREFLDFHMQESERPPAVGNTVAFDKSFLQRKLPRVADKFHYRVVDISSFKYMFDKLGIVTLAEFAKDKIESDHRVFSCLNESIREFEIIHTTMLEPVL